MNHRPEDLPRNCPLTLREQFGLLTEASRNGLPHSYYRIFQLVYCVQGFFSSYFHVELCKDEHQMVSYRHKDSDKFLRITSLCCECVFCPRWIFEHYHMPSKKCNPKCSIRPVYRPVKTLVTEADHDCFNHIDRFPPYFVRRMLLQYPPTPFSPFFQTEDHYRISSNILMNGLKPFEEQMRSMQKSSDIEMENLDVNLSDLFTL